jgi:hypothetical protein
MTEMPEFPNFQSTSGGKFVAPCCKGTESGIRTCT